MTVQIQDAALAATFPAVLKINGLSGVKRIRAPNNSETITATPCSLVPFQASMMAKMAAAAIAPPRTRHEYPVSLAPGLGHWDRSRAPSAYSFHRIWPIGHQRKPPQLDAQRLRSRPSLHVVQLPAPNALTLPENLQDRPPSPIAGVRQEEIPSCA